MRRDLGQGSVVPDMINGLRCVGFTGLGLGRVRWAGTPLFVQRASYRGHEFLMEGILLVLPQGLCLQRRMIGFREW